MLIYILLYIDAVFDREAPGGGCYIISEKVSINYVWATKIAARLGHASHGKAFLQKNLLHQQHVVTINQCFLQLINTQKYRLIVIAEMIPARAFFSTSRTLPS